MHLCLEPMSIFSKNSSTEQKVNTMAIYPKYDPKTIQSELRDILPEEALCTSYFERINNALDPYTSSDIITQEQVPYVVVRPGSTTEVSLIMKYANEKKIPVFVRGSGTSLHGASKYRHAGIVISTRRLNHIRIEKDNNYAEFGPGHRVLELKKIFEKEGYFLPLVPGSIRVASVGGMITNNSSAHAVDSCMGKTRDRVLGLEVVLPTGEVIETGTKSLRRPAGTDLTQYFVGGDGLLGVITGIRMQLVPMFCSAYGVAYFSDEITAAKAVQRIYLEKAPVPLFLEYLDKRVAKIAYKIQNLPEPVGSLVMFHAIGQTDEEATYKINRLVETIQKESIIEAHRIEDLDEWHKIWLARESALPYICQGGKGQFGLSEIVSTVRDLDKCMEDTKNMYKGMPTLEKLGEPYIMGHIGALTFHPVYIFPADWSPEEKAKGINEMFIKEGEINMRYGTVGGEWGQFAKRTDFYKERYGNDVYRLVKNIKKVFDPNNILNPDIFRD